MENNKVAPFGLYILGLSLLSSLLMYLAWHWGGFLLFMALIPLLEMDIQLNPKKVKGAGWYFFGSVFLSFFLSNLLLSPWLWGMGFLGAVSVQAFNSLCMSVPFLLFRNTKRSIDEAYGYFSLILYYLSMEYLQLHWSWAWPVLNLGHGFDNLSSWIQWYEFTGVLGGSLWVLSMNIFIFLAVKSHFKLNRKIFAIYALLTFSIAFFTSLLIQYRFEEDGKSLQVEILKSSPKKEVSEPSDVRIGYFPVPMILSEGSRFESNEQSDGEAIYFEGKTTQREVYRSQRKIPGLEKPLFSFLKESDYFRAKSWPKVERLESSSEVFRLADSTFISPILGYEMMFGERLSASSQAGGEVIIAFGNHWQDVASLSGFAKKMAIFRAIEQRSPVALTLASGSAFLINARGEILEHKNLQAGESIQVDLKRRSEISFYAVQGDYLGRLAAFLAVALFLTGVVKRRTQGGKTVIRPGLK